MINYEQIRNKMNFGDVIAFSGKGATSNIIKWKTKSEISHVGIVYDVMGNFKDRRIMLMESTTLVDIPDAVTKELVKGVQQQFLSQRLNSYSGDAWWYPLKAKPSEKQKLVMYQWLTSKHASRTPYDTSQALGAGLDMFDSLGLENTPDYSKLFCSELVAKVYNIAGLIDVNASEQTPADICNLDCLCEPIRIK